MDRVKEGRLHYEVGNGHSGLIISRHEIDRRACRARHYPLRRWSRLRSGHRAARHRGAHGHRSDHAATPSRERDRAPFRGLRPSAPVLVVDIGREGSGEGRSATRSATADVQDDSRLARSDGHDGRRRVAPCLDQRNAGRKRKGAAGWQPGHRYRATGDHPRRRLPTWPRRPPPPSSKSLGSPSRCCTRGAARNIHR